jgi:hypothetical protein
MLAERNFPELGIKVIAHKDLDNGKAYRSIEVKGLAIRKNNPIVAMLAHQYSKSLSKVYTNIDEFIDTIEEGETQALLIPDIQYGDATVISKFESVCSFIEKSVEKSSVA